mgnify:CR=1 FL=1
MNYLAHCVLAGSDVDLLLGGIAGDFVKGRLERIADTGLRRGVALHRRIDSFTDSHSVLRRSRARLPEGMRRYGGILTDMLFDHYLARDWGEYGIDGPLAEFSGNVYKIARTHAQRLPPSFLRVFERMAANDWLASYAERANVEAAVDRVAVRVRGGGVLIGSVAALGTNYHALECDFRDFFPSLRSFVAGERERLLCEIS